MSNNEGIDNTQISERLILIVAENISLSQCGPR